jgi:hypothetical protein
MANCDSNKNINKTFVIEPLELTAGTPTITACTGIYTSKIIACSGDTSIEIYSGLTFNGYTLVKDTLSAVTVDASTIMSGGTNILEIIDASDTFVTGSTYDTNSGVLTISRNDGVNLTPSGFTSVINHTVSGSNTKSIAQNDMYLIWDDFTINSGSTVNNNGRLVVVNGDFNNFGSYSGSGSLELITTNLEYILNHGNETNGNLIFYTQSPSGWVSGDSISDISAATGNVLVTKEWVDLKSSVDNNDFTTGATLVDETIVFNRNDSLSAYTVDISSINSGDTFVTGFTISGNTLEIERNDGVNLPLDVSDIVFSGGSGNCISDLYVTNINGCSPINVKDDLVIEAKIIFSGTPLLDNTLPQLLVRDSATGEIKYRDANSVDTFVTGTTFTNNQLNIALNNGTSVGTTIDNLSGLTVDGNLLINGDVNIIGSATTINSEQVLIKDNIITLNSNVTGSTTPILNSGFEVLRGSADTKSILWLENTDLWSIDDDLSVSGYVSGTTYYGDGSNLTGIAVANTFVTGGTYSGSTIVLNRNDGNSVNVTGITSDSIYTANGTLTGNRTVDLGGNDLNFKDGELSTTLTSFIGTSNPQGKFFSIPTNRAGYLDGSLWFRNLNNSTGAITPHHRFYSGGLPSYVGASGEQFSFGKTNNNSGAKFEMLAQYSGMFIHNNAPVTKSFLGLLHLYPDTGAGTVALNVENPVGSIIMARGNANREVILRGTNVLGTEKISLQGETLISEKLELSTTTDGFLMPRLTTAQMNAISSPDTNLMVFDTDLNSLQRYNGAAWVNVSDDTFVTGGTYSGSTIVLNRNDGNSVNVTGITSNSIYTADGALTGDRTVDLDGNSLTFNATGLFKISNGTKSVYPGWNTHSSFNIDGGSRVWSLYSANASSTFNANEFGIGVGSSIPFRIFNDTSIALGGVIKSNLDTNYNIQTNGNTLIGGNLDAKSNTNFLSFDFANYPKMKIGTSTSQWWFVNSNAGNSSTFADNDLYLWDSTNSRKVVRFNANGSTELLNKVELSTTTDGFLMPRLTTAQKNAISSPDTNLMVFDTDLNSLQRYNGAAWVNVSDDTFVTGGTYSGSTIVLNRNDGNSIDVTGITSDSIYTANGTLTGNRTVDLGNTNNLTIENSGASSNFQINAGEGGYSLFNRSGGLKVVPSTSGNDSLVCRNTSDTVDVFNVERIGGGYWNANGGVNIGADDGVTDFANFSIESLNFYANGSLKHQIGFKDANDDVFFHVNGSLPGRYFIIGSQTPISNEAISLQGDTLISKRLELSTTTDGFLMPRLTTAQMNAISTPDTHLLIFNTTLNALYRYNGSAWVAMSAGYGVIGVMRDSDNGSPTFYSDLQSALETCKTAGSSNTINIYSNITITSAININRGGSGVGNGYQYKNLTIDFNGFTLTNNEADSSYCFDISFGNIASENRQITFKNGIINRTSGTGTHYTLHCDETENDGHLIMSNMRWYCENSNSVRLEIDELDSSYKDFGGSVFESDGGTPLRLQHYSCKNFTTISNSSLGSVVLVSGAKVTNFEVINTSTGDGIDIGGDSDVSFFKVKTTSGIGIDCSDDYQGLCSHFYIETTTGDGIDTLGTNATYKLRFSNFEIRCDNGICIDSNHRNTFFSNFTLSNNGSSYTISAVNNTDSTFSNGTAINYGSGQVVFVGNTNNLNFKHVDFISKGGSIGTIGVDNSAYNVYFENCTLHTEFNDAAGVNLTITNSTGTIVLTTCSFRVANSSANCIYATSAKTISLSNSNFKGATTPINSNITLSNTNTIDDFGNLKIG